jgi:hypothetical protein
MCHRAGCCLVVGADAVHVSVFLSTACLEKAVEGLHIAGLCWRRGNGHAVEGQCLSLDTCSAGANYNLLIADNQQAGKYVLLDCSPDP